MQVNMTYKNNRRVTTDVTIESGDLPYLSDSLASVILPVLIRVREVNITPPTNIAQQDVPESLRTFKRLSTDFKLHTNSQIEKAQVAWGWILDEMIWAFTEITNGYPIKDELTDKAEASEDSVEVEFNQYQLRFDNALRLFGKFYSWLTD